MPPNTPEALYLGNETEITSIEDFANLLAVGQKFKLKNELMIMPQHIQSGAGISLPAGTPIEFVSAGRGYIRLKINDINVYIGSDVLPVPFKIDLI